MSDRIDPADVAAFFEAHPDIKPMTNVFVWFEDDAQTKLVGCCGLTSQIVARSAPGGPLVFRLGDLEDQILTTVTPRVAEVLHLENAYAVGFALGWDNEAADPNNSIFAGVDVAGESFRAGWDDGFAAHQATTEATRS